MKQIGEGRTAEIFEHNDEKVLKLYRSGFPKKAIMYEYKVNTLIASLGIPAPKVYELVEVEDRIGILFQYIKGSSLIHKTVQNPLELKRYAKILAELHVLIHTHEIYTTDLSNQIRLQKEMLEHNIQQAKLLSDSEQMAIIEHLEKLPNGRALCHGDFHPDNAMVDEQQWIIDWMNGMIGHPAGDVARTLLLFRYGTLPEGIPSHFKEALSQMRDNMGDEYLDHYLTCTNLLFEEIDQWLLPVAAARLTEWIPDEEKEALLSFIRERLLLK
ncbi:phosphotransferase family protein [Paenibacillus planticolens]|uniref:Phosphotransferase n=1 Tax=Paenibacillus planticolens TaxID=2654976 RepID=A0ABX1ZFI4_9BACL|nr:phosphotransferase [Paenibacillus planticolens]NOU98854.1 phosphotransferase [Paenibacillus planticolens]